MEANVIPITTFRVFLDKAFLSSSHYISM